MSRWRYLSLVLLCGLVMLAFALRAATLDGQSLWRDEVDALCYAFEFPRLAARVVEPGSAENVPLDIACPPLSIFISQEQPILRRLIQVASLMVQHNGPLYYFLLRGWVALTGQTPFALRYFSLLPGVLLVPLMYVLGVRLGEPPAAPPRKGPSARTRATAVGLFAAVCAAAAPYMIWYSQETKMYALVTALAVLAVYSLHRALCGRSAWWVVMVVATSLCVYLHILAALLIPVEFVLFLIWGPLAGRKRVEALIAFACLTVPYLPLLVWQLRMVLTPAQTGYLSYSLPQMAYVLFYGFSAGVVGNPLGLVWIMPLVILAIVGLLTGSARLRHKLALAVWVLVPVLVLYTISTWRPIFTDRYLIWIAPAVYILVAFGLVALWRQTRLLGVLALMPVLIFFGWGIAAQASRPIKSDVRAAAQFAEQRATPDDVFIFQIPHIRYTFDYYYDRPFDWLDGLYTNYGMSDAEVDAQMRLAIDTHRVVWLVASEMPMWDKKLQVFNWLETHARRTEAGHFTLVEVYRYELP